MASTEVKKKTMETHSTMNRQLKTLINRLAFLSQLCAEELTKESAYQITFKYLKCLAYKSYQSSQKKL